MRIVLGPPWDAVTVAVMIIGVLVLEMLNIVELELAEAALLVRDEGPSDERDDLGVLGP